MDFIWKEFCSWYLELSKDRIYNDKNKEGQLTAKYVLLDVFQTSMRLLQPIMPFITEEIWQDFKNYFPLTEESLVIAAFPEVNKNSIDEKIDIYIVLIQEMEQRFGVKMLGMECISPCLHHQLEMINSLLDQQKV